MKSRLFDHRMVGDSAEGALELITNVLQSSTEYSIIGLGLDGIVLLWNEGARRIYGYSAEEAVGEISWERLFPADEAGGTSAPKLLELASREGKWEGTLARARRDGAQFVARVVVTPRRDVQGRLAGFLVISRDISEEIRAERAEETLRDLVELAPDAMVIVDREGRMALVNSQTETLFGYSRQELLGQPVEILVPPRFRDQHGGHRAKYSLEPRVRPMGAGLELFGLRRDGSEFPVEISLSPLPTARGVLFASAIRDISERKRIQRALQAKNVELERASLAKDRFLASMSHELRTPLNAILGFTGTLLMRLPGPLTPDQEKQLRIIKTSGEHLLSLINDLLDLAKIESGKVDMRFEAVDCRGVAEEVATALRPLADEKRLTLLLDLPREELSIMTDRRAIHQILLNLANNAIKFTETGHVVLRLERRGLDERWVTRLVVEDTGVGIAPVLQARLFQPFEQLDEGSGRARQGSGLGLHLSRKLADLLGGRITLDSERGRGSRFAFELEHDKEGILRRESSR